MWPQMGAQATNISLFFSPLHVSSSVPSTAHEPRCFPLFSFSPPHTWQRAGGPLKNKDFFKDVFCV